MAKGIVLKSASFEPLGDEARQTHLETTLEKAGFEVETPPEPKSEESDEHLTDEQRRDKNIKSYRAQVKGAKNKYDDWDAAVNQDIPMHKVVQEAIFEQGNGAEVVYYLGKHPDFAKKLGKMTPLSAVREVERLSARLGANAPSSRHQEPLSRRPANLSRDASSAEILSKPNYPGKAKDFRRALAERR